MARHFLSIQKKFLLLLLLVGLIPAFIGIVMTALGGRFSFARATMSSLEADAEEIATRLGEGGSDLFAALAMIVATSGGDFEQTASRSEALTRGPASADFDAVVRYRSEEEFDVRVFDSGRQSAAQRLREKRSFFARFLDEDLVPPTGFFTDIDPEDLKSTRGAPLVAYIFHENAPGGGLVFFLCEMDEILRDTGFPAGVDFNSVYIYSTQGYMLTSARTPGSFLERVREEKFAAGAPGSFWVWSGVGDVLTPVLIGYFLVPRLSRYTADGVVGAPLVVMATYDMGDFLDRQSSLISYAIIAALIWALILTAIAIFGAMRVVGPVKRLRQQAEAMAGGNLNARAMVRTGDEIQDLAETFNEMAFKLRESYLDLRARVAESHRRAEHINVINEITKAITQALDLDRTFEILKRDLKKILRFDGLWIALIDEAGEVIRITHAEPPSLPELLQMKEIPAESSSQGETMRAMKAACCPLTTEEDHQYFENEVLAKSGFKSYLVAPLPSVERVLGTLVVVSTRPEAYGEEETFILESVASAVAVGIEQAELFERARQFTEELEQKVEERTRDLAQAQQKLIQTEKYAATGRLAANMAHEINNPLGIIKNYLRIVTEKLHMAGGGRRKSDPKLDQLAIMNEEIDRIARIVRQLLDLHRPAEQEVKRTDIGALLSDLLALMEQDLAAGGIEIECEFDPDLPELVVAPDLLRQVFINLLRNAQDAIEGSGKLTVKTETRTQWTGEAKQEVVAVSISDTGTGIDEKDLGRIFDPFFTTKSVDSGTGLGLSVSYGIIQMYKGSIEVDANPGGGTTMTVILPIAPLSGEEGLVPTADSQESPPAGSDSQG